MKNPVALKDYFDGELAQRLSNLIKPYYPGFPTEAFTKAVTDKVGPLPLKGRVAIISEELRQSFGNDYEQSVKIPLHILGPENNSEEGMFTNGYFLMPVAHFVEEYGLNHFDLPVRAMYEITKRHTAKYTLRPYLACHLEDCLHLLHTWVYDRNLHVHHALRTLAKNEDQETLDILISMKD